MIKIAICDDIEREIKHTSEITKEYLIEHQELSGKMFLFRKASDLLNASEDEEFDIYLLDIIMPEINGIELGKHLRNMGKKGVIIYLTTSMDYAVESYDIDAFFYLLKPIESNKFYDVMDRAVNYINSKKSENIIINTHNGILRIPVDDILYAELSNRTIEYYLYDNSTVTTCVLRESFVNAVKPLLTYKRFMLCGASFLINLSRIMKIEKSTAVFSNKKSLTLPRTLQHEVKKKWMEYWLEGKKQ